MSKNSVKLPKIVKKPKIITKPKTGKIEGHYWVWKNGAKTHLRFMIESIKLHRAVPPGFMEECKKSKDPNLNRLSRLKGIVGN